MGWTIASIGVFAALTVSLILQDDARLEDVNIQERIDLFVNETLEQAKQYRTVGLALSIINLSREPSPITSSHRFPPPPSSLVEHHADDGL